MCSYTREARHLAAYSQLWADPDSFSCGDPMHVLKTKTLHVCRCQSEGRSFISLRTEERSLSGSVADGRGTELSVAPVPLDRRFIFEKKVPSPGRSSWMET